MFPGPAPMTGQEVRLTSLWDYFRSLLYLKSSNLFLSDVCRTLLPFKLWIVSWCIFVGKWDGGNKSKSFWQSFRKSQKGLMCQVSKGKNKIQEFLKKPNSDKSWDFVSNGIKTECNDFQISLNVILITIKHIKHQMF